MPGKRCHLCTWGSLAAPTSPAGLPLGAHEHEPAARPAERGLLSWQTLSLLHTGILFLFGGWLRRKR